MRSAISSGASMRIPAPITSSDMPFTCTSTARIGGDWKGNLSPVLYVAAILSTFWSKWIAQAIYVLVALIWLIPDRRIEHALKKAPHGGAGN